MLSLRRLIYKQTSAYGHFGRNDLDIPWEKLDKVANLWRYIMVKVDYTRLLNGGLLFDKNKRSLL